MALVDPGAQAGTVLVEIAGSGFVGSRFGVRKEPFCQLNDRHFVTPLSPRTVHSRLSRSIMFNMVDRANKENLALLLGMTKTALNEN